MLADLLYTILLYLYLFILEDIENEIPKTKSRHRTTFHALVRMVTFDISRNSSDERGKATYGDYEFLCRFTTTAHGGGKGSQNAGRTFYGLWS